MKYYIGILFLSLSLFTQAQVVNIEKKRADTTKTGWQGTVNLSLNLIKNTNQITIGSNSLQLQHYKDRNTYLFFNDITVMEINKQSYLNSGFQHIRYNYDLKDSNNIFIVEAFTQIQYNKIQKLQRRFLWGGGMRYILFDRKKFSLYAGTSFMYEFELLLDESYSDLIRLNSYLYFNYQYSDAFSIDHITYYQPSITDFDDNRVSSETSLNFKINKHWKFKSYFNLNYDARPPKDIPNMFYCFNNGISYSF